MNSKLPIDSSPTRRSFIKSAATALSIAALGNATRLLARKADPDEEAILGTDPLSRGPYHLGKIIYSNPLRSQADLAGFRLEGEAVVTFPNARMRLENKLDAALGQKSNFVYWFPTKLPANFAASWEFRPIRDPGLCMVFFSANGKQGEDLFSPALPPRHGDYAEYHHGSINTLHLSYFRRSKPGERFFQTCNLRKSYGFHLVAEGADPLPSAAFAEGPYAIDIIKCGPEVSFYINRLPILTWTDDGKTFGPQLGEGYFAFRQMAPLQAEYENFVIREVQRG
jgi:hypothetical protein